MYLKHAKLLLKYIGNTRDNSSPFFEHKNYGLTYLNNSLRASARKYLISSLSQLLPSASLYCFTSAQSRANLERTRLVPDELYADVSTIYKRQIRAPTCQPVLFHLCTE